MNMIFDTHAHYDDEAFAADRVEVLNNLTNNNVCAVVNPGAGVVSSKKAVELANAYDYIYAAVGVHPENIDDMQKYDYISELENLILQNKKVVAVGEIGLDYHFVNDNKQEQKELFESQIQLALKYDLPVIIHDRDAHGDTLEILKKYRPKGVVHCFSGSAEMAKEVLKLGMYIGVGGVVTFKNAKNIIEVVKLAPLESIVLETDAPYLAPVPLRGERNVSSNIKYVARKISDIKQINLDYLLEITKGNAYNLYSIN